MKSSFFCGCVKSRLRFGHCSWTCRTGKLRGCDRRLCPGHGEGQSSKLSPTGNSYAPCQRCLVPRAIAGAVQALGAKWATPVAGSTLSGASKAIISRLAYDRPPTPFPGSWGGDRRSFADSSLRGWFHSRIRRRGWPTARVQILTGPGKQCGDNPECGVP